jgi:hypothetical protein
VQQRLPKQNLSHVRRPILRQTLQPLLRRGKRDGG